VSKFKEIWAESSEGKTMSEWQPIETAPDSTTILVWHKEYGSVASHILVTGIWGVYTPGVAMMFQKHLTPKPTHWMPLPAPPKEDT